MGSTTGHCSLGPTRIIDSQTDVKTFEVPAMDIRRLRAWIRQQTRPQTDTGNTYTNGACT